jgi:hypothetical protein
MIGDLAGVGDSIGVVYGKRGKTEHSVGGRQ